MLPESILEELTRHSYGPVQEAVVCMAWPSLTVETKLQVLDKILPVGRTNTVPPWLMNLALRDEHTVVRFWAARRMSFAYLPTKEELFDPPLPFEGPAQLELTRQLQQDPSEMVRSASKGLSGVSFKRLENQPQLERLLMVRHLYRPHLFALIDWLKEIAQNGIITDYDLRDIVDEFFRHPDVRTYLADEDSFRRLAGDDMFYFKDSNAIVDGWMLAKTSTPGLQYALARNLPISRGYSSLAIEQALEMPTTILEYIIQGEEENPLVRELKKRVAAEPNRFDDSVVRALAWIREDEDYRNSLPPMAEEQKRVKDQIEDTQRHKDRERIEALERQLNDIHRSMHEQFGLLASMVRERRGFFS